MKTVGLLTFHSAYNFGSVLQAFATSCAIDAVMGKPACEIVNYRTDEQKAYYNKLYRTKYGLKTLLKDVYQAPNHMKRLQRASAFELFINHYLPVSQELNTPEEVYSNWDKYEVAVSGSDQIWNHHALELEHAPGEYIDPYFLKGFSGKKISYASSIGNMSIEELKPYAHLLEQYERLSTRERLAAELIEEATGRSVEVVPDPTLLLDAETWSSLLGAEETRSFEDCLVYYSLAGIRTIGNLLPAVKEHARQLGLDRVAVITPFARVSCDERFVEAHPEYGPLDFLAAMQSAGGVVTDSFHGTMFSIVFGKRFLSLSRGSAVDYRKAETLDRLGLRDVFVSEGDLMSGNYNLEFDFPHVGKELESFRRFGLGYLKSCVSS